MIIPKPLKQNDTIAITAPSGAVLDKGELDRGVHMLENLGLQVIIGSSCIRSCQSIGVDVDRQKALELESFFANDSISGILCARGGYGCIRLLPFLHESIFLENPKCFVGYSDITVLHRYLNCLNIASIHGAMVVSDLGRYPEESVTLHSLKNVLFGDLTKVSVQVLQNGTSEGILVGGNLSTLCSLAGTVYYSSLCGKILFMEDINEPAYKIDRMLWQCKINGIFEKCRGVILGGFTTEENDSGESMQIHAVLHDFFAAYSFPVVKIEKCGHTVPNLSLLLGAKVKIENDYFLYF